MMKFGIWMAVVSASMVGLGCAASNGPEASAAGATEVAAVDDSVACPALAREKYPFLTCVHNDMGEVVFDSEPQVIDVSRMPDMDPFVESDDYWGN